jgi:hypothetical protein
MDIVLEAGGSVTNQSDNVTSGHDGIASTRSLRPGRAVNPLDLGG